MSLNPMSQKVKFVVVISTISQQYCSIIIRLRIWLRWRSEVRESESGQTWSMYNSSWVWLIVITNYNHKHINKTRKIHFFWWCIISNPPKRDLLRLLTIVIILSYVIPLYISNLALHCHLPNSNYTFMRQLVLIFIK